MTTRRSNISEEELSKISEVRQMMEPLVSKFPMTFTDESLSRYLRARNMNTKKTSKMIKEALKWRLEYKPDKIRWDEVVDEARTGKLYIANYLDKNGRTVFVMRPGCETSSTEDQIKHLVYCMERAIMNLKPDQEQMVWLISFDRWNMASISVRTTRETAHVLQDLYPERLALALLYNPPKIFESFWMVVKPFLEPKTYKKVKFVYSNDEQSQKLMDAVFERDKLEHCFGGNSSIAFDFEEYSIRMREEENKMKENIYSECGSPSIRAIISELPPLESGASTDDEKGVDSVEVKAKNDVACNEVNTSKELKS